METNTPTLDMASAVNTQIAAKREEIARTAVLSHLAQNKGTTLKDLAKIVADEESPLAPTLKSITIQEVVEYVNGQNRTVVRSRGAKNSKRPALNEEKAQIEVCTFYTGKGEFANKDLAERFDISAERARKLTKLMVEQGYLHRTGSSSNTSFSVTEEGTAYANAQNSNE